MKKFMNKLTQGGRVTIVTIIAVAALSGVVYAASGHVLGVRSLASGSSTPPPPAGLTVSSSLSRTTIYHRRTPKCTTFAYITNKSSRNTISISGVSRWARGLQAAGRHTFLWCGHSASGNAVRRGFYTIAVHATRNGTTKSSSRTVRVRRG
jgi:hypothetical protein